jgi:hypothetical protein
MSLQRPPASRRIVREGEPPRSHRGEDGTDVSRSLVGFLNSRATVGSAPCPLSPLLCSLAVGLVVAAASAALGEPPAGTGPPRWMVTLPGEVASLAMSPDGRCVAALWGERFAASTVSVFAANGERLWEKRLKDINPWLQAEHVSAAPGCEWVVVSGTSSYKYVWAITRKGSRWHLGTSGTPEGVGISHAGDLVVVGTAAGHLYLVSDSGRTLREVDLGWEITGSVRFSPDDRHFIANRGGLLDRQGKRLWEGEVGYGRFEMSRDLSRFVLTWEAPHGPAIGSVTLLDGAGNTLWYDVRCYIEAMLAEDGSHLFVRGGTSPEDECYDDPTRSYSVWVVDRDGKMVGEYPEKEVITSFVATDKDCIVITRNHDLECRDRDFRVMWTLPYVTFRWPGSVVAATSVRWIAAADGGTVSAYRYPPPR